MYEELIKGLRWLGFMFPETHPAQDDTDRISNNIHLYCMQAADAIEKLQTDVRPVVRGKWEYDHWCKFKCSNCGAWSKSEPYCGRENFCPNCGADMREPLKK